MSQSNSNRRKKALAYFQTRTDYYDKKEKVYFCICGGEFCKAILTEKEVEVNHKNNNNTDDRHRNLEPASHSCNVRLGFIQRRKYKRVRIKYVDPPATMKKNIEIKKKAKEWLAKTIVSDASLHKSEVVDRLAHVCDANVLTIERLLRGLIVNEEETCPYQWHREEEEEFVRLKNFTGPS